ncbi:uncharacterized protein SRS1_15016 [Sporisorium reilianum f. sp. reilianum]|uniref:Uncharacterized protein n=1 Tax=Sporisorium reilianum f. sp. reilianum TaxID=72559 RepID=A0A2N8UHF1_9BASI|nr:uncharacterized protein SRS1_15016 [Sporisorium reilianum f. sp. reilianum]
MNSSYCFAGTAGLLQNCCSNPQQYLGGYRCIFNSTQQVNDCLQATANRTGSDVGLACTSNNASKSGARRGAKVSAVLLLLVFAQLVAGAWGTAIGRRDDGVVPLLDVGYYADENCQTLLKTVTYEWTQSTGAIECGYHGCAPALLPEQASMYAKAGKVYEAQWPMVQVYLTRDQVCPPTNADAVIAVMTGGKPGCIQLQGITGQEGASIYPCDDGPLSRRALLARRDDKCSGFTVESQQDTYSASSQVSSVVNCQNSAAPCIISESVQHTTTIESSFSLSAGGSVEGIDIGATFGTSYSESTSTTLQQSYSIPVNQEGYLTTYAQATLFKGTYTGCAGGDQPGEALVLKDRPPIYQVVITNA